MTVYAVIGSRFTGREWETGELVRDGIASFVRHLDQLDDRIVTGDAQGADTWVREAAEHKGILVEVVPAEWEKYGRKAGVLRNPRIIAKGDVVVAFWDGLSPGTKNGIKHAKAMVKPRVVFEF
jgi:hypothetical protein